MTSVDRVPALLLHGQPGSGRDWRLVLQALGESVPAIAPDRPGWDGRSAATDLDGNARAALRALDRRGGGKAVVVGHSFGGAVAAWLAAHYPERVHSLVLVAPAANQDSLETVDRWLAAPVIGHLASAATLSVAGAVLNAGPLRRRIAGLLSLDDDRYLQSAARRLLTPAAWRSFVLEQRVLIQDLPVLERRLDRITVPTRIVTGSRDAVVPIRSLHRLVRQIPAAELIVLEGAGHLLPLRDADALAEIIRRAG